MLWVACGCFASPARAQMNVRVFGDAAEESFAAVQTFEAVFGQSMQPLFGGGVEVTLLSDRVFVDLGASQFKKTGDRVFRNGAQVFHLGIPMHVTLTPLELTGGYRFHVRRHSWLVPYAGAGVGWYRYRETSDFATDDENVDTRHAGFVVHGGLEFRVHRWVGVGTELAFTHVPGILGAGGISQAVGENDLGGVAGRFRIVIGK
ncbi:MAG TPA: hypothetical protein VFA59_08905 [Vicinamibacterales bacterium]|nr:hypothetical protein [Vicinamibacterales bacterium]